jgi:hypothetical protein
MVCSMTQLETRPRAAAPPAGFDGPAFAPPPRRRRRRWWVAVAAGLVVLAVAGLLLAGTGVGAPAAPPVPSPTPVRYDARGRVAPVAQARVGTIQGGTLRSAPAAGRNVLAGEELARIESPLGNPETVVAPFAGTVLAVPVQVGDTLVPGALVALVGDLTQLRVETTDVDEYLVAGLRVGQELTVVVDALPGRQLKGRIAEITLSPQPTTGGDLHYPVYVALERPEPGLRPGMTARIKTIS